MSQQYQVLMPDYGFAITCTLHKVTSWKGIAFREK